jgi:glycosyltransferase involved in cell wall biosynthesis
MNEQQPLVSIITIVFNGEKHLQQTIESVLGQTYPNVEYLIIDGGSTDNTVSIIKNYSSRLAYWISEKDKGVSDAFNKGISKATGDIIGLINADDWYEKDAVEKVVQAIGNNDVVYGNLALWRNEKQEVIFTGNHYYLTKEMTINHPTVFVRRQCYLQYGLFDLQYKYAMDYDFLLSLFVNGRSFKYIPSVLANMRWEGLSDRQWFDACKEVMAIKNKFFPDKTFKNKIHFAKQVAAIRIGKVLQSLHLNSLVRFYRNRLSRVKKIYN